MVETELEEIWDGHMAILDGAENRIYLDPDPDQEKRLRSQYELKGIPVLC
jgi:phosphoenolpyruvate-protein kinase (PTS system EI component)